MTAAPLLPVRLAHPYRPALAHLDDAYFELLCRCGYDGIYLQDSPFDNYTGNVAQFFQAFHLISLYDIAYSYDRERVRDYIHEVAARAARYGLHTYLQSHEPRLPYYAWSSTPREWRGHGGWPHEGNDAIAYCWSVPEAVAWWQQMARDAFAALPELSGVTIAFLDNEAVGCDARCPRCQGQTVGQLMQDVVTTYAEIGRARGGTWRMGIVDWWLDQALVARLRPFMGEAAFLIGQSCFSLTQEIDGERVPGTLGDMSLISAANSPASLTRQHDFRDAGFRLLDRTTWSHPLESWYLPAPPDPRYAVEKLNALVDAGVEGWQDFDCAGIEPGSIADAVAAWTAAPDTPVEALVTRVLTGIFGAEAEAARPAYEAYTRGKAYVPVCYDDPETHAFSARFVALSLPIAGPWYLEDFMYFDTRHAFNFFAPFNLVTRTSLAYLLPRLAHAVTWMEQAYATIARLTAPTPAARRERDAFEIHARHYQAMTGYLRLGATKLAWLDGTLAEADYIRQVRDLAAAELANHQGVTAWLARNPGGLYNPCHSLVGTLSECWPGVDFHADLLRPKRVSLERLLDFTNAPPLPLVVRAARDNQG